MPIETITVGPFSAFFTNINREMRIPGHSHFAEVTLVYRTLGSTGFPAFATTYAAIQDRVRETFAKPLHNHTNENVARLLWTVFREWNNPAAATEWGAAIGEHYQLVGLELAVRGVPDAIGHADGFTRYRITEDGNASASGASARAQDPD